MGAFISGISGGIAFDLHGDSEYEVISDPLAFIDFSDLCYNTEIDTQEIVTFLKSRFNEAVMGRSFIIMHNDKVNPGHILNASFHSSVSCISTAMKLVYSKDLLVFSFQSIGLANTK